MYILVKKGLRSSATLPVFEEYFNKPEDPPKLTPVSLDVFEPGPVKVASITNIQQDRWNLVVNFADTDFAELKPNPMNDDKRRFFTLLSTRADGSPALLTGDFYLEVLGA